MHSGEEQADVEILAFDFVAVCNGVFHEPYIPKYEGMDEFSGRVIPSCDVTTEIYNACKHPVVVGGGKSGLDSATAAAQLGLMPTVIVRRPIWIAPRFVGGLVPGDFLLLTRMSSRLLPYHHLRGIEKFLHGAGKVIPKAFWQTFSFIFRKVLGMPSDLTPDPLPKGLEQIGVGGEFFVELNAGRAAAKRGIVKRFEKRSYRTRGRHAPIGRPGHFLPRAGNKTWVSWPMRSVKTSNATAAFICIGTSSRRESVVWGLSDIRHLLRRS